MGLKIRYKLSSYTRGLVDGVQCCLASTDDEHFVEIALKPAISGLNVVFDDLVVLIQNYALAVTISGKLDTLIWC